ncbi:glycosyltransferase [Paenibacillus sp. sptzw28]|uniref:glycosyltransferase family 4 protein n=1 Tax=Paenibacillus sp. sptzw28 TaxID=715179 RepID=UPI001C6DDC85|nr:glycosyltransferase family 4 protein [Paenibacillus sp. sptzw28]QYR21214.1 glycosyltransferase [Paenibacillus sp. sptzw28]
MRILFVTHHLQDYAGTETYLYTLTKKLVEWGHEITIYAPLLGKIKQKIEENGVYVTDDILVAKNIRQHDIIHCHHNTTTIIARKYFPHLPIVVMVHGVLPFLEQTPEIELGISKYLAVSEEVKNHLNKSGVTNVDIINNAVDIIRYSPLTPINTKLKKVLVLSNHFVDEMKEKIEEACRRLNIEVFHIGYPNMVWDTEHYINKADLVITLGRGVLESMACGRAVLVYDIHGGDGMITESLLEESLKNNLSGRRFRKDYTVDDLIDIFHSYHPEMGEVNRSIIIDKFCIDKHSEKLIDIYKETIEQYDYSNVINVPNITDYFFFYQQQVQSKCLELDVRLNREVQLMDQIRNLEVRLDAFEETNHKLEEKNRLSEETIHEMEEKNRLSEETIHEMEEKNRLVQDENNALKQNIQQMSEKLKQSKFDLDTANSLINELNNDLNKIKSSKIWRYSTPLRKLVEKVKKI